MSYVIYHKETFKLLECRQANKRSYDTEAAAKAAITRVERAAEACRIVTRLANFKRADYIVSTMDAYLAAKPAPKMVTVINLMSGLPVLQAEDTPRCCDVSSELYWSM